MKEVKFEELSFNPAERIAKEWMLVSAGDGEDYGSMTASWGHIGSLWGHGGGLPTAICYIRPQRDTKHFADEKPYFSLCFLPKEMKQSLVYMGTHSGRDGEKAPKCGLTPVFSEEAPYFEEASLVLICRKLYQAPIVEEGFLDIGLRDDMYPKKDYHTFYIGEIVKALASE